MNENLIIAGVFLLLSAIFIWLMVRKPSHDTFIDSRENYNKDSKIE